MKHDGGWKTRSSRNVFESKWFRLRQDQVELPSGEPITYTMIEHPGYAMVVPLFDDGRVLMERVFRYTVQETLLECPSGGLDGDAPEIAAHRELEEETGWLATQLVRLGSFYGSGGISNERGHFFLARGLSQTASVVRTLAHASSAIRLTHNTTDYRCESGSIRSCRMRTISIPVPRVRKKIT